MSIKSTWDESADAALVRIAEWLERWPTEQHWLDELEAARKQGFEATYELLRYAGIAEAEANRFAKPDYKPVGMRIYSDPATRWKSIMATKETIEDEKRDRAIFGLKIGGFNILEAEEILDAGCDSKEAAKMAKAGRTKEEIIKALKKNDGGLNHPSL